MTAHPDKKVIARHFSRKKECYDQSTDFHNLLAQHLIQNLPQAIAFDHVLEVGSHTGLLTKSLQQHVTHRHLTCLDLQPHAPSCLSTTRFVCADGEQMPFSEPLFDLIISSSTFQWYSHWEKSVKAHLRLLKANGLLAFTQFLSQSLEPLRQCFQDSEGFDRFLPLLAHEDVVNQLQSLGQVQKQEQLNLKLHFPHFKAMLDYLRKMGVSATAHQHPRLSSKTLRTCQDFMEDFREPEGLPLKLEGGIYLLQAT